MIEKLVIKNYLIIKDAEICFSKGLNILTGETGAGKSIILDALSLILGERADYSLIKKDQDKLVVEGHFNFANNKEVKQFLKYLNEEEYDLKNIILRRELLRKGISRNFINDSPVNISDMKRFGDIIVDIHSQNEHQSLLNRETHTGILDSYVDKQAVYSDYQTEFQALKELIQNYKNLNSRKEDITTKRSFLDFQLNEINKLNLSEDEDIRFENELKKLENIEQISNAINNSIALLYEEENNALSLITTAIKNLKKAAQFDKNIEKVIEDLESSYILVKESSESLNSYQNSLDFDNSRIDQIRNRLDEINHIKRKFALDINGLLKRAAALEQELVFAENFDYEIEQILKKIENKRELVFKIANQIYNLRVKKGKELVKSINSFFVDVGLELAEFKIEIKNNYSDRLDEFSFDHEGKFYRLGANGINEIEFFIKANKGSEFSPLKKSASGGEVSRIMLAIKTALSEKDKVPILVFDEIDIGISGRIAVRVGKTLKKLSGTHQIICITHLPQIAAMSDCHFHVSKKEVGNETVADIKQLSKNEKIIEVAKLISGEKVTDSATKSAKELINN